MQVRSKSRQATRKRHYHNAIWDHTTALSTSPLFMSSSSRRLLAAIIGRFERTRIRQQNAQPRHSSSRHRQGTPRAPFSVGAYWRETAQQQHSTVMRPEYAAGSSEEEYASRRAGTMLRIATEDSYAEHGKEESMFSPPRQQLDDQSMGSQAASSTTAPETPSPTVTLKAREAQHSLFRGALGLLHRWQLGRYVRTRPAANVHVRFCLCPVVKMRCAPWTSSFVRNEAAASINSAMFFGCILLSISSSSCCSLRSTIRCRSFRPTCLSATL